MKRLVIIAIFAGWLNFGSALLAEQTDQEVSVYKGFNIFVEVMDLVRAYYLERTDLDVLTEGAIEGMILSVDRFGYYESPTERPQPDNRFGFGMICSVTDGQLTIVDILPQSPAEKAELRKGDMILSIGEKFPQVITLRKVEELLHPPAGETIAFQVFREGENRVRELSLKSEQLTLRLPLEYKKMDSIIIVTLRSVKDKTAIDTLSSLVSQESGITGLILDLRGCTEGDEDYGLALADRFIKDDLLLGEIVGKNDEVKEIVKGQDGLAVSAVPTIVIVDSWITGGGEVFAAALQHSRFARILGSTTAGRGIKQQRTPLDGGGAVVMTTGFYKFGDSKLWGEGIKPDIEDTDELRTRYEGVDRSGISDHLILHALDQLAETTANPVTN